MRKIILHALLTGAIVLLASCEPGESEQHYTAVMYPAPEGIIYADQTVDSVKFITFDDWRISSAASWASVSSDDELCAGSVPAGYYVYMSVPVYFETNTTGKSRVAMFNFATYDRTLSVAFIQNPYHNIARPAVADNAFTVECPVDGVKEDSLVFTAYAPWTLTLDADIDWVTPTGDLEGAPGRQVVRYSVAAGNADATRKALLRLESAGVATSIEIVQKQ